MKPIISPWIFYLLDKVDFLDFISFFGVICSLFGIIVIRLYFLFDNPYKAKEFNELYKELKIAFIILLLLQQLSLLKMPYIRCS